jgi:phospholipid/cholesterol/gamma-HCH transport system ATP-binding protein
MILLRNLKISFNKMAVLNGINLEINRGELMVIMGKNGSGKSVLLKSIAGLIKEYDGTILLNNIDIKKEHRDYKSETASFAYVFQKGGLFDSMNVFDNVAFGLRRKDYDEKNIDITVKEALGRVGLAGSEEKMPSELSGGMQKRVGLARAICLNPDIILYDDPTAGLDPILSDSIGDLILDISRSYNTTSMVVTHDLSLVRKIAETVALLYNGKLVFNGAKNEFFLEINAYTRQFINGEIEGPIDIF